MSNDVNHWISSIISIDTKQTDAELNKKAFGKIIGPPSKRPQFEQQFSVQVNALSDKNKQNDSRSYADSYLRSLSYSAATENQQQLPEQEYVHYIIVKIPEKVFIDSLDIYETSSNGSLTKIEAQESQDKWMCIWECSQPHVINQQRLFRPTITPTPFKSDTLKLTLNGSLYLIDAIEVKGKSALYNRGFSVQNTKEEELGALSMQMYKLVANDSFADVYFEVEGKRIPAHRNILSCRCEYFAIMLSKSAAFRESNQQNPIYLPNISYEIFKQVLVFLYTGHFDTSKMSYSDVLELMRAADSFMLNKLEELIFYYIGERIDETNIITIFREANEKLPVLTRVNELCYDHLVKIFNQVVVSEEFCALPQKLMVMIIENVVPQLPTTELINKCTYHPQPSHESTDDDDDNDDDDNE